jgi:hypothetical protein
MKLKGDEISCLPPGRNEANLKILVRKANVPAEIRTGYFPNINQTEQTCYVTVSILICFLFTGLLRVLFSLRVSSEQVEMPL